MAGEQTNPETGVAERTIEDRMAAFVKSEPVLQEEEAAPEVSAEQDQPESQVQSDELEPGDIPDDDAPPVQLADEAWEIVHNGQSVTLTREEVIRNAQQGFDYTKKTQELAQQRAEVQAVLQRAAMVEQMAPLVAQDLATVKAFESQLQQYNKVDWVRLAREDPLAYPEHRATYDQLLQAYQGAHRQFQHKANALHQERNALNANRLHHEAQVLTERIPEWRDPAKYQAGAQELRAYLIQQGADQNEVDALSDSLAVSIARKAMLYDRAMAAKTGKTKQLRTVPPVPRPGAPSSATAEKERTARQRLRTTGDRKDAVGLLLSRMK